jgi:hypothetical protein
MKSKAHFQRTFAAQTSFEKYGRKSKREQFLDQMNEVVPWVRLLSLVEPHYPKAGNGRRPVGLEIMLRSYLVQQWFNLSDPGMISQSLETVWITSVMNSISPNPTRCLLVRRA